MPDLDLSSAIEAAAETLAVQNRGPWVSGHGIREGGIPWGTSHEADAKPVYINAATEALTAALPHILDALAEQAETQYTAAIHHVTETQEADDWHKADDLAAITNWLRHKAVEVRR